MAQCYHHRPDGPGFHPGRQRVTFHFFCLLDGVDDPEFLTDDAHTAGFPDLRYPGLVVDDWLGRTANLALSENRSQYVGSEDRRRARSPANVYCIVDGQRLRP